MLNLLKGAQISNSQVGNTERCYDKSLLVVVPVKTNSKPQTALCLQNGCQEKSTFQWTYMFRLCIKGLTLYHICADVVVMVINKTKWPK